MHSSSSILMVGRDLELLRIRKMVLESAGNYDVRITTDLAIAKQILGATDVDLLLLCQTLLPEDCDELAALMETAQSQTKVLVLEGGVCGCSATVAAPKIMASEGPKKLLEKIDALLTAMAH